MSGGDRQLLGRWGEARAAEYLNKMGYRLIAAGWKCRFGEVDLIVQNKCYLVFVEVKLRKNDGFAQAREFVTRRKQEKLISTAKCYLLEYPTRLQPRFDVVEVYAPQGIRTQEPRIPHLEDAFC